MKKSILFSLLILVSALAFGQSPVTWSFAAIKKSEGVYEVQMTANIQRGWHLYSQTQPKDAIAVPTSFSFIKSPLLTLVGSVKETGKLEKYEDKVLDVTAHQYSNKVMFVQTVKLKGKAKTALTGKLEFQTCDDKKCLPPKSVPFSVPLS